MLIGKKNCFNVVGMTSHCLIQMSHPGPSWPSCFLDCGRFCENKKNVTVNGKHLKHCLWYTLYLWYIFFCCWQGPFCAWCSSNLYSFVVNYWNINHNVKKICLDNCNKFRTRPASAYAQSDQVLHCPAFSLIKTVIPFLPFPTYSCFVKTLLQVTFKNVEFLILKKNISSMQLLLFKLQRYLCIFARRLSRSSAVELLYVGKG